MIFYIKCFVILAIILLCTILGNRKANTFKLRELELKNIQDALQIFISKIEYTYKPISEIFEEISKVVYLEENNIFKRTNTILNEKKSTIAEAWNISVEEENNLMAEDKEIIKMLGRMLGKTDKVGQIAEIQVTNNFLNTQILRAEEEKKKNTKLYKTLGTVIGCGIGIILF